MESCAWSPGCRGRGLPRVMDAGCIPGDALGAEQQHLPSPVHREPDRPEWGMGSEWLHYCRIYRGYV